VLNHSSSLDLAFQALADPTRALRKAERWIAERRASWERRLDRLGDYLDETKHSVRRKRS